MIELSPRVQFISDIINEHYPSLGKAGTYIGHGPDEYGPEYSADYWSTNKDMHDAVLKFVMDNARNFGVEYIITWDRIWNIDRADEGIRFYERDADGDGTLEASERHTNHIHITYKPESENMAVSVNLSSESITKLADAIGSRILDKDYVPAPNTRASTTNPTWAPKSFEKAQVETLDNILAELRKP